MLPNDVARGSSRRSSVTAAPRSPVLSHQRAEVDVEQHVAADEQARVALAQERRDAPDAAAGVEQLGLAREGERDAGRAVAARRGLEALGEVMGVDDHLAHAVVREQRELVGDQRDPAHRHGRLRQQVGERAQPRAEPRGDDHRAHGDSGSSWRSAARSATRASRALARAAARRSWRTVVGA